MKRVVFLICLNFLLFSWVSGQSYKSVIVESGKKVGDYFPVNERYLYPQFLDGQIFLKRGVSSPNKLNFNLLSGEIEFITSQDTLMIIKKNELSVITIAQDTFIYSNSYLRSIHSGKVRVYLSDRIELKEILKEGAMGAPNRTSAVESYGTVSLDAKVHDLVPTEDLVFRRTLKFYILTSSGELIAFRKKDVLELMPDNKDEIQKYLKSNRVNYESIDDILRFSAFLEGLLFKNL